MKRTSEAAFEAAIEAVLLANGYSTVDGEGFDRERAIFPTEALVFSGGERDVVHADDYQLLLDEAKR